MKKIVNNIFENHGFLVRQLSEGNLYSYPKDQEKTSFWLVIDSDDLEVLENQNNYFQACKNALESNDIDKNTSLLIIAHKIPFVRINVEQNDNLQSLFDTNYSILTYKGINEFDDLMETSLFSLSTENFEKLSPEEILQRLTIDTPADEN